MKYIARKSCWLSCTGQGFDLTQATLSRDLKALKVAKVPFGWLGLHVCDTGGRER